jgi:glucose/arabinose dehydrogenase
MRCALLALVLTAAATACGSRGGDAVAAQTIATGLHVPWGVAFLPGGAALVSERTTGRILGVRPGHRPRVVMRVPGVDTGAGEGGLLGLAVSPHYRRDHLVYAYFTSARDNRIVRFRLGGALQPVLTGLRRGYIHDGGRIAFGPDGKLYAGVGETGDTGLAQDRASLNGKILRINPDGSVPRDNPFPGSPIWSLGHRNVQGLAWDRAGRRWESEFGQDRFDEINLIRPGRNYGWPLVEGHGDTRGGRLTNPKVTWRTDEASPSGAAIAEGALYVGALQGRGVWRVPLHGTRTGRPRLLFAGHYGRVRTVVRAPDGSLWLTTSNRDGRGIAQPGDDRIVRFKP